MNQMTAENDNYKTSVPVDAENEKGEEMNLLREKIKVLYRRIITVMNIRVNELPWYKRISSRMLDFFFRLTIAKKMLFGYGALLALIIFISIFALFNLNRLNSINNSILERDIPIIDASDVMIDAVLDQELFASRYAILKTPDMLEIFWDRSSRFEETAKSLRNIPDSDQFQINMLNSYHREYDESVMQILSPPEGASPADVMVFEETAKAKQEDIIDLLKTMSENALDQQMEKTGTTAVIGSLAFKAAALMCAVGFILSLLAATLITRNISGAIKELRLATEMVSDGKFDYRPNIKNTDELRDLSDAFIKMSDRLRNLEAKNLDSSPLTRLPGGVTIEKVMDKRIETHESFAFCLMDIDNFKAFNDRYGYAKGNQLIKDTAKTIKKVVSEFGNEDDFVGHIGGDDFVLVSSPERYAKVCDKVIADFNKKIPDFYSIEDNNRGYIVGENRQGKRDYFPLASISIAVVTDNENKMDSYIKVGEIAAELKEYAKMQEGSVCVFDKRVGNEEYSGFKNVIEFPKNQNPHQEIAVCQEEVL